MKESGSNKIERINAYYIAFKEVHNCSTGTWENKKMMQKIEDDLKMAFHRYNKIVNSSGCRGDKYKIEQVGESIKMLRELMLKNQSLRSVISKDSEQRQNQEVTDDMSRVFHMKSPHARRPKAAKMEVQSGETPPLRSPHARRLALLRQEQK